MAKALTKQVKISFAVGAMALSLGLILTHSIIPPTPGPVGAAGILNADLGLVIILGLPITMVGLITGWLYSIRIASKIQIDPIPDKAESEKILTGEQSVIKSLLPVFIPILLSMILMFINYVMLLFP